MAKKLVIIPAYNEERSVVGQCLEVMSASDDYDVVVINDGSEDDTARLCAEKGIKVLNLAVNLGIGGAMQTGYRYAYHNGYDIAVQVDGDGQHDPGYLDEMYEKLVSEDADMVIGSRFIENEGHRSTTLRRIGIRYFTFLIKRLTGQTVTDPTSGFRMAGRKVIREFAMDYPQDYPEPESLMRLIGTGRKVIEMPVRMRGRTGGISSISFTASVYYMIKVTIAVILERMRKDGHKA